MEIIRCQECKRCKDSYCSFWGREVEPDAFCYKAERRRLPIKPEIIAALREIHDECDKWADCVDCPFLAKEIQKYRCSINAMIDIACTPRRWNLSVFGGDEDGQPAP